jgi:ATP-dependent Zn protease
MPAEDQQSTATHLLPAHEDRLALAAAWRRLARLATVVAILTSPAAFLVFYEVDGWSLIASILATFAFVAAFRGLIDVIAHRFIPRASLYGAGRELLGEDIVNRRRLWFWKTFFRWLAILVGLLIVVEIVFLIFGLSWSDVGSWVADVLPLLAILAFQLPLLLFANLLILFGPLLYFGLRQMKGYEPGDADWGVKLSDVRGQAEPKQEVTRVISLWQSGEAFRAAGGKPERGVLFLGAPGVGKTMLAKAIATSFNSPIMTMPGSGFAQTFIGMDVVIVMILIARARRLARKWGGQCIVFIDEIDAVGLRRQALGGGMAGGGMVTPAGLNPTSFQELAFYGPWGSLTPSGDIVIESREWRERLFTNRAPGPTEIYPPTIAGVRDRISNFMFPGGMMGGMGGGMALNQLLVQMDGVDEPPVVRKFVTKRLNTFLDAAYIVPQRVGRVRLRLRPPRPRSEQVYFIGATNVNPDVLDPALLRPGRMGRHIWFRTPSKDDRKDIFDLYLGRVAHEPDLDGERRREELARITHGYSPAMIEQVCSMALTYAHADERPAFGWTDIVEAMTTIETGTAQNVEYIPEESRATAIHEAGHAIASHLYMDNILSTRLSIRKRGGSLGHYQGTQRDERFSAWRHEEIGGLVMTLGAMAAEHVFYGENTTGVGGDVQSATMRSAYMVGLCGMGPEPVDLRGRVLDEARDDREREIMDRFERIGIQIMNRAGASPMSGDPLAGVLSDPGKRAAAARILGQCYLTAVCAMRHNREAVAEIAEILVQRRELYGDEVVELLDRAQLEAPAIDVLDEQIWPKL